MSSSQTASRHQAGSGFQPYIGLRPFTEQEKDRFFGRSNETSILLDKIRANRLTLLLAASGVGKSSLLQAGIMPELRTDSNIELIYYNVWSASPQAFKQAVSEHYGESYKEVSLKSILRSCTLFSSGQLILLLDQFEELFNYHRFKPEFQPFIEELSAAVLDRSLPVSFVFSMREDFALELNSFKDSLPGVFDNYFRLEKLTCEQAREAIEKPLEGTGYCFAPQTEKQEALLDQVLHDLAKREQERQFGVQGLLKLNELPLLVEPPHLQIVCQELWERHRDDKIKQLAHAAYDKAGRTAGILNSYFLSKIELFSKKEQILASEAFDHLVGTRAVKIAHPLGRLAELARADVEELQSVLDRLQDYAILRRQKRGEEFWYELYHDIFSESIDIWNREFKARQRVKRFACGAIAALFAGCVLFAGDNWRAHYYGRYLQLSPKVDISDRIEVYQGRSSGLDLFLQRKFRYEASFLRQDVEADKKFYKSVIENMGRSQANMASMLPLSDRIPLYMENGLYVKGRDLIDDIFKDGRAENISFLPQQLASARTTKSTDLLLQIAKKYDNQNVAAVLAQLDDKRSLVILLNYSSAVRQSAAEIFGRRGDNSLSPVLIKLLGDESVDVRLSAANALGRMGNKSAAPTLVKLLYEEENQFVRRPAAEILCRLRDSTVAPVLVKLLDDDDRFVQQFAAEALGRLGDSTVAPVLVKLLNDGDPFVQQFAAEALGRLGDSTVAPALVKLLHDNERYVRQSAAEALGRLGDSTVAPVLVKLLDDEDQYVRQSAAESLNRLGVSPVPLALARLLDDEEQDIRQAAAKALDRLGDGTVVPALINLLDEEDQYVRRSAVEVLGRVGGSSVSSVLVKLLDDGDQYVRRSAAEALGRLGDSTVASVLVKLLDDGDQYVRQSAAEALGKLGDSTVAPALVKLLDDEEANVRGLAAETLGKLGDSSGLLTLLNDKERNIRDRAATILGRLGDSSVAPSLIKLLDDEDQHVRRSAAEALGRLGDSTVASVLVKLLDDGDQYFRQSAAEALGKLGDSTVAPALIKLLGDENANMRGLAAEALGRLRDYSVVPTLIKLFNCTSTDTYLSSNFYSISHDITKEKELLLSAAEALGRLGYSSDAQILVKLLEDEERTVRSGAVKALGWQGGSSFVPDLVKLLDDEDAFVREYTARTLGKLNVSLPELRIWQEEQFKEVQEKFKQGEKQESATKLGFILTKQSVIMISKLLADTDQDVIEAALKSIGTIGEYYPELVQAQTAQLLKLTTHDNFNLRRTATTSLGQLISFHGKKTPTDLPELHKRVHSSLKSILFDRNKKIVIRQTVLDALGATGRKDCAEEIYELLGKLDKNKDESLRYRSLLWLGRMAYNPAGKYVEEELKKLEDEKADWRKRRDSEELGKDLSDEFEQQDKSWKKEHWEYMLGNSLARIKPETTGIDLLNHPLYQVRQGAIRALAAETDAPLIGKIIQAHQNFDPDDLPSPFPYAAFRAIDLALWNLEYTGKKEDVSKLKDILKNLKPCQVPGQEGAIEERLEWTIDRLDENLAKNAKLATAK